MVENLARKKGLKLLKQKKLLLYGLLALAFARSGSFSLTVPALLQDSSEKIHRKTNGFSRAKVNAIVLKARKLSN